METSNLVSVDSRSPSRAVRDRSKTAVFGFFVVLDRFGEPFMNTAVSVGAANRF